MEVACDPVVSMAFIFYQAHLLFIFARFVAPAVMGESLPQNRRIHLLQIARGGVLISPNRHISLLFNVRILIREVRVPDRFPLDYIAPYGVWMSI